MRKVNLIEFYCKYILIFFGLIALTGCGQNDDQREFERMAFSAPDGITETNAQGEIIGDEDRDDWRISPFYQGLIDIQTPAFPNPVLTTDQVRINIISFDEVVVDNIEVISFFANNDIVTVIPRSDNVRINLFTTITMQPSQMSRIDKLGLKRIIILDRDGNVISYGDIEVI